MAARINNFPANLVYDKTRSAGLTFIDDNQRGTNPPATLTGVIGNVKDRDLTSVFTMDSVGSSGDGGAINYSVVMDCGSLIWNATVSAKYFRTNGNNCYMEYSFDNVTWYILHQTDNGSTSPYVHQTMALRYFRVRFLNDVSGACTGSVYEMSVSGSG